MAETRPAHEEPNVAPFYTEEDEVEFDPIYWRPYDHLERNRKHHETLNPALHDNGVHTYMDDPRLAKLQAKLVKRSSGGRRAVDAHKLLHYFCDHYARPEGISHHVCDEALTYLKKLLNRLKTHSVVLVTLASIYIALVNNCYSVRIIDRFTKDLGLHHGSDTAMRVAKKSGIRAVCAKPELMAVRVANQALAKMDIDDQLRQKASLAASRVLSIYPCRGSPQGCAGAALYVAFKLLDESVTMMKVAKAIGISDATIRANIRRMGIMAEYYLDYGGKHILVEKWDPRESKPIPMPTPSTVASTNGYMFYDYSVEYTRPLKIVIRPKS